MHWWLSDLYMGGGVGVWIPYRVDDAIQEDILEAGGWLLLTGKDGTVVANTEVLLDLHHETDGEVIESHPRQQLNLRVELSQPIMHMAKSHTYCRRAGRASTRPRIGNSSHSTPTSSRCCCRCCWGVARPVCNHRFVGDPACTTHPARSKFLTHTHTQSILLAACWAWLSWGCSAKVLKISNFTQK